MISEIITKDEVKNIISTNYSMGGIGEVIKDIEISWIK